MDRDIYRTWADLEPKPVRPAGRPSQFPAFTDGIKDGGKTDEIPRHSKFGKASEKYTLHAKPKRGQKHIAREVPLDIEHDTPPGETKTKRNWRLQQTGKLFKKPKPWYRTKGCKIVAAVVCVVATALTIWGSIELDKYLKSRNNIETAVATQNKPADKAIVTKSMPKKTSLLPSIKHTEVKPASQDCQDIGCGSNQKCLTTGKCVCVDGFAGDFCDDNINECEHRVSICPSNYYCIDTIGSYSCQRSHQKEATTQLSAYKKTANWIPTIATIVIISLIAVIILVSGWKMRRNEGG